MSGAAGVSLKRQAQKAFIWDDKDESPVSKSGQMEIPKN
jgi:hypothetical protein